ncbi:MAG: hypothetical protein KGI37_08115 [Alphaproteobacteria bacterium]|nr:hypothetical protein [Alphaproteobacteria bacterium]
MRLSFIGMSNIGKTYWSKRVAAENRVPRADCDMLIETKLDAELSGKGLRGIRDVALWMGQPGDPQYPETSARYAAHEQTVMDTVLDELEANPATPGIVDTTGSVIYVAPATLARLRAATRVVYLEASDQHIDRLFRSYAASPKPLIWGDCYAPRDGETPRDAMRRCYPLLLESRHSMYRQLAHVTIPFARHKNRSLDLLKDIFP